MQRGSPSVVVIGAGIGGLSAAACLAARGLSVQILDRAGRVGGKAAGGVLDGRAVDTGPTVLTMPWVFERLFRDLGGDFRAEVDLEPCSILARHVWPDGSRLDLHADARASADAIGVLCGSEEARAYARFAEQARRIYAAVEGPFLTSQRPTYGRLLGEVARRGPRVLLDIDGLRTMWSSLESTFADPRLRQLFGRYATYCGSSPFEAPGTLSLIAHVEAGGVWRPRGGMWTLPAAIAAHARRLGAVIRLDAHVERVVVEGRRVVGVEVDGERIPADVVVFNGDASALGLGLLGAEVGRACRSRSPVPRSASAVTWTLLGRAEGFPLVRHDVFFSNDYRAEFDAVFGAGRVPDEPTVYVCAQDRGDDEVGSAGERFLVLVNAPANGDEPERWTDKEIERCRRATHRVLERAGLRLHSTAEETTTPADFHRRFPGTGGALYGPRARGSTSAFARSSAASAIRGLYVAGGSVHPGPGVPMAALSGMLACARIVEDLSSTTPFRSMAIAGTTSTA
jgi:1-hydroxycarotenoid 3,4-desaturase